MFKCDKEYRVHGILCLLGEAGRELDELSGGLHGVVPALLLLRVLGDSEVLLFRELSPAANLHFSIFCSGQQCSGSMTYWCGSMPLTNGSRSGFGSCNFHQ
jgi:hypothetical protein